MTNLDEQATESASVERAQDGAGAENAADSEGVDTTEAPEAPDAAAPAASAEVAEPNEFQQLKGRLEEIAAAVDGDNISLDEALDLYEEAVALSLQAIEVLDVDITAQEEEQARMLEDEAASDAAAASAVEPASEGVLAASASANESTPVAN